MRILLGKNFKQGNRLLEHSLVCSARILSAMELDGIAGSRSESYKSHSKRPDSESITTWNEVTTLTHILTPEAMLHVRVFESHILKDVFVCEAFLPLRHLVLGSGPGSAAKGDKDRASGSPCSDCLADDIKAGVIETVKEKGKGKEAEDDSSNLLHVFGNMFHSSKDTVTPVKAAGSSGSPSSIGESSENASSRLTDRPADPLPGAGAGAGAADKKTSSTAAVSESLAWYKCFGRKADNEETVEKGEIYVGITLE